MTSTAWDRKEAARAEAYEEGAPNLFHCYGAPCLNRYFGIA